MITITVALTAATLLAAEPPVVSQSFDCAKAQTRVEKLICSDAGLRELDEYLGRYYAAGRGFVEGAAACLQSDQAQWLKTIRNQCADASCLKAAYLDRLGELDPLQPGASALRNITLPSVPSLVWIIAPASDTVAAPPNPKAKPFEATGSDRQRDQRRRRVHVGDAIRPEAATHVADVPGGRHARSAPGHAGEGKERDVPRSRVRGAWTARARSSSRAAARSFTGCLPRTHGRKRAAWAARRQLSRSPHQQSTRTWRTWKKCGRRIVTQGKVCPDPNRPCVGFKPHELSFAIAQPFKFDRGRDRSQPFFAVILKSGPLCGIDDSERVAAQQQFPDAKVFLHRYFCEDFGDKVTYTNINEKSGFVAVYAGERRSRRAARCSRRPRPQVTRMRTCGAWP